MYKTNARSISGGKNWLPTVSEYDQIFCGYIFAANLLSLNELANIINPDLNVSEK